MTADGKEFDEGPAPGAEKMDQAICIYGADGTVLFFNQEFREFLDLPETVVYLGAQRAQIVEFIAERGELGPGDAKELAAARMWSLERDTTLRYRRQAPNGRVLDVRRHIMPDGQIVATFIDITATHRLETAVAAITKAVSRSVGQGYLQDLADASCRALGMEWVTVGLLDEATGETITTLAASRKGTAAETMSQRLQDSPCAQVIDRQTCAFPSKVRELFPDDEMLAGLGIESYVGVPLFDTEGKALGVLAAFNVKPLDDTALVAQVLEMFASRAAAELDRGRTFDRLQISERRFRNFAEIGSDWLWEMDADLRFTWIGDNVEALTGQPQDYFIGKSRDDLRVEGDDPEKWARHKQTLLAHKPFRDFQYRRELPDGRTMWVSNSGVPLFDEDGRFQGYFGASSNITERKRAEAELWKAKGEAEEANRAKSRFLAGVSHELRTPLNAIIGFSEIIGAELFGAINNPAYVQYGKDIHISGQLLLGLITDILDLSQIDAEELSLKEKPEQPVELIGECVRLFLHQAEEARIEVSVDVAEAPKLMFLDARRIKQILVNLIGNAIKFTPSGGHIKVTADQDPDGWVVFEVEDSGIGMPSRDIERALEPFSQLDTKIFRGQEGVGLGLAISSRLALLHGGHLRLISEPDVGTRAQLLLPASRVIDQDGRPSTLCS